MLYCTQKSCSVLRCLLSGAVTVQPQGAGLSLPICKQDWWGKEGKGGKKVPFGNYSLPVNPRLTEQPAPQTPKHVRLKLCAANQCNYYLFLLFGEIVPTGLEGWERRQHSQPKQPGVGVQLTGGRSLKPSAISKKCILENTMATKLHQIWNWAGKQSSLNLFNYLNFPDLVGVPPEYFKQDISLLFLKPSHSITE